MSGPSREFMVQQAVLNAGERHFPVACSFGNLPKILRYYTERKAYVPRWFVAEVRHQFRTLASQYSEAA